MPADTALYDALLTQLSQLSALRPFEADSKVPKNAKYPPHHYDFKMPPILTTPISLEDRVDYFSLTFKTLKAPVRMFTLHTSSIRTVGQVKKHLSRVSNIAFASMRLVLNGKGLVDSKLIGDYPITRDSVIQIICKPSSGAAQAASSQNTMAGAVSSVSEVNPLSSVLDIESAQPKESGSHNASAKEDGTGYASDASSVAPPEDVSSTTRSELKTADSAFRNQLRDLVVRQFNCAQATAVNELLDSYLSNL